MKTYRSNKHGAVGGARLSKHRRESRDLHGVPRGGPGAVALDIAGGCEVVNTCICISGADGGGLGRGAGARDARCAAVAVGGCAANHGSDRIAIADGVVQPLQDDRVHAFGLDIPISLDVERVAFPRRRCRALHRPLVHVVLGTEVQITRGDDGFADLPGVEVPARHVDRDQTARARGVDGETGSSA